MSEVTVGIVALLVLLALFATGFELGFAMALVGFAGFAYVNGLQAAMNLLGRDVYDVITSYGYTVFPLFILMGQIGLHAGIAVRMYNAAHKFVGHIPGGLAMATVIGATGFKAICGSSAATSATFASVAIPEMDRFKYDRRLSTGIVATVGTLGVLIPPSVTLIIFGIITEQSIGQLFLAGIIPGLVIAFFFLLIIYGWARLSPSIAPRSERSTWKERFASLPELTWIALVFILVVGGIMQGYFTPTEAGAVAHVRRLPALGHKTGDNLQDIRAGAHRVAADGGHGPHFDRGLRDPRPFHRDNEHPAAHSRLARRAAGQPLHSPYPYLLYVRDRRVPSSTTSPS